MGRKDTITKQYLARPDVFADAFNYYLFEGNPVIHPYDLKEQDPTELIGVLKSGTALANQRIRDVLKLCNIRNSIYQVLLRSWVGT